MYRSALIMLSGEMKLFREKWFWEQDLQASIKGCTIGKIIPLFIIFILKYGNTYWVTKLMFSI